MPQKTLADTLAARETLYVNCGHPKCCKSTKLDIQALIDRLGPDHGSSCRLFQPFTPGELLKPLFGDT